MDDKLRIKIEKMTKDEWQNILDNESLYSDEVVKIATELLKGDRSSVDNEDSKFKLTLVAIGDNKDELSNVINSLLEYDRALCIIIKKIESSIIRSITPKNESDAFIFRTLYVVNCLP